MIYCTTALNAVKNVLKMINDINVTHTATHFIKQVEIRCCNGLATQIKRPKS